MTTARCLWCEQPFEPVVRGGRPKQFCQAPCKDAFHRKARLWAEALIRDGFLTPAMLRNLQPPNPSYTTENAATNGDREAPYG